MEKINRLLQFECQRAHWLTEEKYLEREAIDYHLQAEYSSLPNNHYMHTHIYTLYCEKSLKEDAL